MEAQSLRDVLRIWLAAKITPPLSSPPTSRPASPEWSSSEQYRLFFELNPQPMWIFSPHSYQILDVNSAVIEQFGYTRDELGQMNVLDLLTDAESTLRASESDPSEISARSVLVFKSGLRCKSGYSIDVEVSARHLLRGD
ncbi:MAG: PAS domain S-box protein, partial [Bdellovibrionaceae bacterium]|nr:PAS domain S-box protein [Pseudobdellovibrionaceae bacterium]